MPIAPAQAQSLDPAPAAPSIEEMNQLSLEELLTKVVVASRKEESQAQAASVITVVDRARIERVGARSLVEILRTVEGFDVRKGEYNDWAVGLRGYDSPANFLVLVDGQRINDPYDGSVRWDLPLDDVERIEIIRGPGSAVYGTNAFVGVISVQTFTDDERPEVKVYGGNDDNQFTHFSGLHQPFVGGAGRVSATLGTVKLQLHANLRDDAGDKMLVPSDRTSLENKPWTLAKCLDQSGNPLLANGQPILRVGACDAAGGVWGGHTENHVRQGEAALRARAGNLEVIGRVEADRRGPGLTDLDTQRLVLNYNSHRQEWAYYAQAIYKIALSEKTHLSLRGLFDQRQHDETLGLQPPGFTTTVVFPDGWTQVHRFTSRDAGLEALADTDVALGGSLGNLTLLGGTSFDWRGVANGEVQRNFTTGASSAAQPFSDARATLGSLVDTETGAVRPECVGGSLCTDLVHETDLAGFGQFQWKPALPVTGVELALTAGLRVDSQQTSLPGGGSGASNLEASPRAGLTMVADHSKLGLSAGVAKALIPDNIKILYGTAFRAPTFKDRYDNLSETFQGNPALTNEHIRSLEAEVGYALGPYGTLTANAFYSKISNSIQRLRETSGIESLRQRADRSLKGVEAGAHVFHDRLTDAFVNIGYLEGTDTGVIPGFSQPVTTHLEDQPRVHVNAGAEVILFGPLRAGVYGHYTSTRESVQRTVTEQVHHYVIDRLMLMDAALRLVDPVPGLTVDLHAYNVFNTRFRDPVYHDDDLLLSATSPTSYLLPRGGMSMLLTASYRFGAPLQFGGTR